MDKGKCSIAGCELSAYCKSLCKGHYARQLRLGDATSDTALRPASRIARRRSLPERLWPRIDVRGQSDCWEWLGSRIASGYGQIHIQREDGRWSPVPTHRVVYELVVGKIPAGLVIDHLCRNRVCCNPAHLEPVTNAVNILRGNGWSGRHHRKTHCPQGHPYDVQNTHVDKNGMRHCRACGAQRARVYRAAKRDEKT